MRRHCNIAMVELPLFPLNTVLFPGMPIHLHIFEPRYRDMVNRCNETGQHFGVVLIEHGVEALGPLPEPYSIGCTAQIVHTEYLDDGRMNIMAIGMERFQIQSVSHDQPYLVGEVKMLPLDEPDRQRLNRAGEQLRPWVERYLDVLAKVAENLELGDRQLPNDPLALAYLAATLLQIPPHEKQPLLAAGQADDLLSSVYTLCRREVALQSVLIERDTAQADTMGMGSFSRN